MKNRINSLKWWVLGCVMLLVTAQSAWASLSGCEGTVYFKLPDGWKSAYAVAGGQKAVFTKSSFANWLQVSTLDIGGPNAAKGFVIEETGANDCNSGHCVRKDSMDIKYMQLSDNSVNAFSCSDFGAEGELWISAHPDPAKANITYVSAKPPSVKYFYVFLPNNVSWKSAVPMIKEGDKKSFAMDIDGDNCGWYFRRYIDEELPSSVLVHRDDDETLSEAIGVDGDWIEPDAAATPIDLKSYFDLFGSDVLYFVADAEKAASLPSDEMGWYTTQPDVKGDCSYDLAALIYDTDASLHGAFTCNPDWSSGQTPEQAAANACYYPTAPFNVVSSAAGAVPCIGITPGMVTEELDKSSKKPQLTAKGKACFGAQADAAFKAMFEYTPNVNEKYCKNITFNQTSDGKWEFDSDTYHSPGAPVPGGFYPAEEPPAATDMLTERLPAAENKRKAEGPVFLCMDSNNPLSKNKMGLRAINDAEGVPEIDLLCNGPGWKGGIECGGFFKGGSEFEGKANGVTFTGDGWGWSCPNEAPLGWTFYKEGSETLSGKVEVLNNIPNGSSRWTSGESDSQVLTKGGRNQHFCFESHAQFRYKKGLRFSFRGDDDIWVYLDNKLAVDLGGTHLAAPGYVDLDMLGAKYSWEVGSTYDIDIFFCDRRTTMSNVRIKTNMYIEQTSGLEVKAISKGDEQQDYRENGNKHYSICYKKSSNKNCAAEIDPQHGDQLYCDAAIVNEGGKTINISLARDKKGENVLISPEEFVAMPKQFDGGIDATKPWKPVINRDLLNARLPAGKYYLIIEIEGEKKYIEFEVPGALGITYREAVTVDENGNHSLPYEFIDRKMASIGNAQAAGGMIPLYIASILDLSSNDPLEMHLSPNTEYELTKSNPNATFYEMKNGELVEISNLKNRKVSEGGVDTIYVTIYASDMKTSAGQFEDSVFVGVKGAAKTAKLTFFVPQLVFVESPTSSKIISGDPDTKLRLKGSPDTLYLVALNPDDTPCGENCNFSLGQGAKTSPGVNIVGDAQIVNGSGYVVVLSSKVYLKKADGTGAASLYVNVAGAANVETAYINMQFQEPPVPTPQLADIFDVHGALPATDMNVPAPYFEKTKEYLDGIGDSLVIYYHRTFHIDSLPHKIEVFWENDKDSVVFDKDEIMKGATCIGDVCENKIVLSGKNMSKEVKTSGIGRLKSWATYKPTPTSPPITSAFEGLIYDRIAPVIVSARAMTESGSSLAQLKVVFSEKVAKTDLGVAEGDKVFSFYINNGKQAKFAESIPLAPGVTNGKNLDSVLTLVYSQSAELFPQAGDYIHFRSIGGVGLVGDMSEYESAFGADTLRPASDAAYNWNAAPGYDATDRLPSPWVLISGDVSTYASRLVPDAVTSIPPTLSPAEIEKLPIIDVLSFDANKDEGDFRNQLLGNSDDPNINKYSFVPHGWFIKNDMGALIESKEAYAGIDKNSVFFDYEFRIFTNLGAHVVTQKGRISCTDPVIYGGDCVKNRRNLFIMWNMKDKKNRQVGSGAFIVKIFTYVQLGKFGKMTKLEKSEMWGVRHRAVSKGYSASTK